MNTYKLARSFFLRSTIITMIIVSLSISHSNAGTYGGNGGDAAQASYEWARSNLEVVTNLINLHQVPEDVREWFAKDGNLKKLHTYSKHLTFSLSSKGHCLPDENNHKEEPLSSVFCIRLPEKRNISIDQAFQDLISSHPALIIVPNSLLAEKVAQALSNWGDTYLTPSSGYLTGANTLSLISEGQGVDEIKNVFHRAKSLSQQIFASLDRNSKPLKTFPWFLHQDRLTELKKLSETTLFHFQEEVACEAHSETSLAAFLNFYTRETFVCVYLQRVDKLNEPIAAALFIHELGHYTGEPNHELLTKIGVAIVKDYLSKQ